MKRANAVMAAALVACLGGTTAAMAQNACEIAQKACADQTAARPGPYYQLIAMIPKPNSVVPEWKVDVQSGLITLDNQFGRSECSWQPASVDRIYPEGVDITIRSTATARSGSVGAFIQLVQGFGPNGDLGRNYFEARAEQGGTASDQALLHIDPHLPNAFAKQGDRVSIDVGGCEAGTMTYVYEYRN